MSTFRLALGDQGLYSVGIVLLVSWILYKFAQPVNEVAGLPVINARDRWDIFSIKLKRRFIERAHELLTHGFSQVSKPGLYTWLLQIIF